MVAEVQRAASRGVQPGALVTSRSGTVVEARMNVVR
jgi:hypothetical protein